MINDRFVACRSRNKPVWLQSTFAPRADLCATVLGNRNSTAYLNRTDVSIFPDYGHNIRRLNGLSLCRRHDCTRCAASAEASAIHSDCFDLFIRECKKDMGEALDHLWTVATWRVPWRQAPHLYFNDMNVTPLVSSVAKSISMPRLRLLPPEIVQAIEDYSVTSLLWRYSTALYHANRLSVATPEDFISVPLCKISAWERGDLPVLAGSLPQKPIIRLTIDSNGISKVERLLRTAPCNAWRSDHNAFVILKESCLEGATIHFKVLFPLVETLKLDLTSSGLALHV
jgi:hypothetical protein